MASSPYVFATGKYCAVRKKKSTSLNWPSHNQLKNKTGKSSVKPQLSGEKSSTIWSFPAYFSNVVHCYNT